jgi:hypothetical protein
VREATGDFFSGGHVFIVCEAFERLFLESVRVAGVREAGTWQRSRGLFVC